VGAHIQLTCACDTRAVAKARPKLHRIVKLIRCECVRDWSWLFVVFCGHLRGCVRAGRYGDTTGLSVAACTGPCDAGYACPAGSAVRNPTAARCPAGKFAEAGATVCSDCSPGRFSAAGAGMVGSVRVSSSYASPPLPPSLTYRLPVWAYLGDHRACASAKVTFRACSCMDVVMCSVGLCIQCSIGQYSASVTSCVDCPAGKFGSVLALQNALCSGDCAAGYACPQGSITSTPTSGICPVGRYSLPGASACTLCPAGALYCWWWCWHFCWPR
jgi:hypothetical protein